MIVKNLYKIIYNTVKKAEQDSKIFFHNGRSYNHCINFLTIFKSLRSLFSFLHIFIIKKGIYFKIKLKTPYVHVCSTNIGTKESTTKVFSHLF